MKYFCMIVITIFLLSCRCGCSRAYAQNLDGLTGPAYAAAKAKQLKKLQEANAAAARPAPAAPKAPKAVERPPQLSGPAYSYARARWLRGVQIRNYRYRRNPLVGPAYAWQVANIKARQRWMNGTWPSNTYFFSRPTVRIHAGTRNTPAFRPLSDPWMWHGQQPWGYWQRRY